MNKTAAKIIDLIKEGHSIPKISNKLKVGRSRIYYHYKKIKGRKFSLMHIPKDQRIMGEFLGAFAGDGSFTYEKDIYRYTIRFHLHRYDDKQYANYLQELIKNHFGKKNQRYTPINSTLYP